MLMPNSCSNVLYITGPTAALERFKSAAKSGDAVLSFESLYPMPDEGWSNEEIDRWVQSNWGSWLVYPAHLVRSPVELQKRLAYEFVTAWSPPIALIERVAPEYPELTFELRFCEPAMDKCGRATAQGVRIKAVSDPECSHTISDYSRFRFSPVARIRSILSRI
jgi:hypothetical protein